MSKMKKNKAAGPDGVVTEMFEPLEEYGVDRLTKYMMTVHFQMNWADPFSLLSQRNREPRIVNNIGQSALFAISLRLF